MKFSNIFFKDLNIYDLLINSIFSIAIAILIFNFTAGFFTIGQLKDFYTGEAVFENYNKQLDVAFFFFYLLYNQSQHKLPFLFYKKKKNNIS